MPKEGMAVQEDKARGCVALVSSLLVRKKCADYRAIFVRRHPTQAMQVLIDLSEARFMHGDLKTNNVMLTPYDELGQRMGKCHGSVHFYRVTLIDFGSAQLCDEVKRPACFGEAQASHNFRFNKSLGGVVSGLPFFLCFRRRAQHGGGHCVSLPSSNIPWSMLMFAPRCPTI